MQPEARKGKIKLVSERHPIWKDLLQRGRRPGAQPQSHFKGMYHKQTQQPPVETSVKQGRKQILTL